MGRALSRLIDEQRALISPFGGVGAVHPVSQLHQSNNRYADYFVWAAQTTGEADEHSAYAPALTFGCNEQDQSHADPSLVVATAGDCFLNISGQVSTHDGW
jgi:hypothetical protein